jgi:hypothetical protein
MARTPRSCFSQAKMDQVVKACDGVPSSLRRTEGLCGGCAHGKMTTSSFSRQSGSEIKTTRPFEIVHSDVMGPIKPKSSGGAQYVFVFVDDFSRYVHVYPLKSKSEVFEEFCQYKVMVERQYGYFIRCIRTDNGGEYTSKKFTGLCAGAGIRHETTAPYSPQQNGLAERMNRNLAETARSKLHHMKVDQKWWAYAILAAAHALNRVPISARPNATPFDILERKKPMLDYFRVFGSEGFVLFDKSKRTKLDAKAHRCLFLGYAENTNGYVVWDYVDERIVISRSVQLDERPPAEYRDVTSTREPEPAWHDPFDGDDTFPSSSRVAPANPPTDIEVEAEGPDGPVDMEVENDENPASIIPSGGVYPAVPNGGRVEMVVPIAPPSVRYSPSNPQVNSVPVLPPASSHQALPAPAPRLGESTIYSRRTT